MKIEESKMNHSEQILELYQALIEGKLQVKTTVSGWVDTDALTVKQDDVLSIYRRKPEPIIRYIATWIDVNGNLRSSGISNIKQTLEQSALYDNNKNFKVHELNCGGPE